MSSTRDAERYRKIYSFYRPRPRAAPVYAAGAGGASCTTNNLTISGLYACAENDSNTASGEDSFAIGFSTAASGYTAFSYGSGTVADGSSSCAGGLNTIALGYASNAIGESTIAAGDISHAEGLGTQAGVFPGDLYYASHAEGVNTYASGKGSHAEGVGSRASGSYSHAEGGNDADGGAFTSAIGIASHAEGGGSTAGACMYVCTAITGTIIIDSPYGNVTSSFVDLDSAIVLNQGALFGRNGSSHVIQSSSWSGTNTLLYTNDVDLNIPLGVGAVVSYNNTSDVTATVPGSQTWGLYSHAEGALGLALGIGSHAEGTGIALGDYSHAEGYSYDLIGNFGYAGGTFSHAEGIYTKAFGDASHAEGVGVQALGSGSHAEGAYTTGAGFADHAEGVGTVATGRAFDGIQGPGPDSIVIGAHHGDVTGLFVAGKYIFARDPDLSSTQPAVYGIIIDSYWDGVNTIVLWGQYITAGAGGALIIIPIDHPNNVNGNINNGMAAHAEGTGSFSLNLGSHSEGITTISVGRGSHSEGILTIAAQHASHAEGIATTTATAISVFGCGHAEGASTTVIADASHAEGISTIAGSVWYSCRVISGSFGGTGSLVIDTIHGNVTGSFAADDFIFINNNKGLTTADRSYQVRPTGAPPYFAGGNTYIEIVDYNIELLGFTGWLAVGSAHTLTSINSTSPPYFQPFPELTGQYWGAHAEGFETYALSGGSHAEGYKTTALGYAGHAEGIGSRATGVVSHAEGLTSIASGKVSHAEGGTDNFTYMTGIIPGTEAYGDISHAEGEITVAYGRSAHAEGGSTRAGARGFFTNGPGAAGTFYIDQKYKDQTANFAPGTIVTLQDGSTIVRAIATVVSSTYPGSDRTKIDINNNTLFNPYEIITISILRVVVSPGRDITGVDIPEADAIFGDYSHAEGYGTIAAGLCAHAEGSQTLAIGGGSHSEGSVTKASGGASHAEGANTLAFGLASHAAGRDTVAIGSSSYASGYFTVASGNLQTVIGEANSENNTHSLFVVGNGDAGIVIDRKDVFRIERRGAEVTGSLIVKDGISIDSQLRTTSSIGTDNYFYVSGSIRRGIESTSNFRSVLAGDLICSGSVSLRSGTLGSTGNGPVGKITLDGATPSKATVTNSTVKATSVVMLTKQTNNHSQSGSLVINSLSSGSFQIMSSLAADTDTVGYLIINVVP